MNAIEIKALTVKIHSEKILDEITLDIHKGKITGLLGPSGAGKTTLYRAILGLKKITAGKIVLLGEEASLKSLHEKVGYMTQSPSIYYDLSVRDNLQYFSQINGGSEKRIDELIKVVDLEYRAKSMVKHLSGGEKTRVSLIIAMLGDPEVLLLDEPTVGLDPLLRQRLWQLLRDYADKGRAIIITSHMMDEADNCDEIIFIRRGKLIAHGSKKSVLKLGKAKNMEEAFVNLARGVNES